MFDIANPAHLAVIRRRLSAERLAPYDAAEGGRQTGGLRLYEWNTAISAAFYALLQNVEVVLRNAIHDTLTDWHAGCGLAGSWLDNRTGALERHRLADIAEARRRIWHNGYPETPGRIVAELPFGFWRYLLAARYEQTPTASNGCTGCATGSPTTNRSTTATCHSTTPTRWP